MNCDWNQKHTHIHTHWQRRHWWCCFNLSSVRFVWTKIIDMPTTKLKMSVLLFSICLIVDCRFSGCAPSPFVSPHTSWQMKKKKIPIKMSTRLTVCLSVCRKSIKIKIKIDKRIYFIFLSAQMKKKKHTQNKRDCPWTRDDDRIALALMKSFFIFIIFDFTSTSSTEQQTKRMNFVITFAMLFNMFSH